MKNNYKLLAKSALITIFAACLIIISNSNTFAQPEWEVVRGERQPVDFKSLPEDAYEPAKLLIKLNPEMAERLAERGTIRAAEGSYVRTGNEALDALNSEFGVTEFSSALYDFYDASKTSLRHYERHKAWGFHLWYKLIIDSKADVMAAVQQYTRLELVDVAEPLLRKIVNDEYEILNGNSFPTNDNPGKAAPWTPNDPLFENQWNLNNTGQNDESGMIGADISMVTAWGIEKGHRDVIVASVGSLMNYAHEDLADNMWQDDQGYHGFDFIYNTPVLEPGSSITANQMAGLVSAVSNNDTGVAGIAGGSGAGDGVQNMICRVFLGIISTHGLFLAPLYAADNGAAIAQNAWWYSVPDYYNQIDLDAIDYFNQHGGGIVMNGGITVFGAADTYVSGQYYPAAYSGTIAVAATDMWENRVEYSNFGEWVDISAPGGRRSPHNHGVFTVWQHTDSYDYGYGTHMACAHVSGVAALLISHAHRNGYLIENNEVYDLLTGNVYDHYYMNPDYIGQLGTGRLDAYMALSALVDMLDDGYVKPPQSVSAEVLSCNQIEVSWTKNEDGDDVMLVFSLENTFGMPVDGVVYAAGQTLPGGGEVLYSGSLTSFLHNDLEAATTYYYRVFSYNETNKYSAGRRTVATTHCIPINTLPFVEDFDAAPIMPVCWESIDHNGNGFGWQFGYLWNWLDQVPNLDGFYAFSQGTFQGIIGDDLSRNTDLVTPVLDLSGYSDVTLSFKHHKRHNFTDVDIASLHYSIDGGTTWTQIEQWITSTSNPETFFMVIPEVDGQSQVRFKWNHFATVSGHWAVDEVVVSTLPPEIMAVPGTLEFGFVPAGSTSEPQSYILSALRMESSPLTVTAPPGFQVSLNGSDWYGTFEVELTPPELEETTVFVRFAPAGEPAVYISNISHAGGGAETVYVEVTGESVLPPGTNCDFPHEILALPFIEADLTTEGKENHYNMENANTCSTGYMEGEEYVFIFEPIDEVIVNIILMNTLTYTGLFVFNGCPDEPETSCIATDYQAGGNPAIHNLTFSAGITYYIVVSTAAVHVPHTPFDIVIVENLCPDPEMLHVINVTGTYVDLTWTASVPGTWNIEWGEGNFVFGEGAIIYGVTENPYTLYGLSPTTEYDFYVQQDCGGGTTSNWVGPFKFWTDVLCPSPVMMPFVSNITHSSADLSWDQPYGTTAWDIDWGESWFMEGEGTLVEGITEVPYTLDGLTPATEYIFYVRSNCTQYQHGVSDWSPMPGWFITLEDSSPALAVTPDARYVSQLAGVTTFDIASNITWTVSESVAWLTVIPMSGSGSGMLTVQYEENTMPEPRSGEITVSTDGVPDVTVIVHQAGTAPTYGQVTVYPESLSETHEEEPEITIQTITVANTGTGMLEFDIDIDFDDRCRDSGNLWTIHVYGEGLGDEVNWYLRDNTSAVILFGGPYGDGYNDIQTITTHNEPLEFYIEAIGPYNDNSPSYSISCGGEVMAEGTLAGGTNALHSDLVCGETGMSWLSVAPTGGTLAPGSSMPVGVVFNSTVLLNGSKSYAYGTYHATINFTGNNTDISQPEVFVPVELHFVDDEAEAYLAVTPEQQHVGSASGTTTFEVESNTTWTATTIAPWLDIAPEEGTGDETLAVTYEENFSTEPRTAEIVISVDGRLPDVVVMVIQDGAEAYLAVTPEEQHVDSASGTTTFEVSSNTAWTAETVYPWLEVLPVAGTSDETLFVTYEENTSSEPREAEITVRAMELPDVVVTVLQNGVQEGVPLNRLVQNETVQDGDSECYDARETVTLQNFLVEAGGTARIIAGESIIMLPGTHAKAGSYLHAWITLTEEFCSSLPEPLVAVREDTVLQLNEIHTNLHKDGFFRVFPNPTPGFFTIEIFNIDNALDVTVHIFGMRGNMIEQVKTAGQRETHFDLTDQQPGIYLVRVRIGDVVGMEKVVKR